MQNCFYFACLLYVQTVVSFEICCLVKFRLRQLIHLWATVFDSRIRGYKYLKECCIFEKPGHLLALKIKYLYFKKNLSFILFGFCWSFYSFEDKSHQCKVDIGGQLLVLNLFKASETFVYVGFDILCTC